MFIGLVLIAVAFLVEIALLLTFLRNKRVARFRHTFIELIRDASLRDVDHGTYSLYPVDQRFAIFDSVSYTTMIVQFWRPLESFYTREQVQRMVAPAASLVTVADLERHVKH